MNTSKSFYQNAAHPPIPKVWTLTGALTTHFEEGKKYGQKHAIVILDNLSRSLMYTTPLFINTALSLSKFVKFALAYGIFCNSIEVFEKYVFGERNIKAEQAATVALGAFAVYDGSFVPLAGFLAGQAIAKGGICQTKLRDTFQSVCIAHAAIAAAALFPLYVDCTGWTSYFASALTGVASGAAYGAF